MTAIWQNDGSRWHLLSPTGFPNEATLHTLVEEAPHLLPLAGGKCPEISTVFALKHEHWDKVSWESRFPSGISA
jgi:hypothetical protein